MKQQFLSPIELCSKCMYNEVSSWVNERWQDINSEAKNQILQELRIIKLKAGNCIACGNSSVSIGTAEKISKILEDYKVANNVRDEFKKFFIFF